MAKFETELVAKLAGNDAWQLTEDLVYKSDIVGLVYIPAGFVTDFASVPRLPLAYLLAGNTAHEAAVVHDYLYVIHRSTKSQADRTFREAMGVTGVPAWRKNLMYAAVTIGGWLAWLGGPKRCKRLGN